MNRLGELDAFPRSSRSLATEVCHLMRSNRVMRLTPSVMVYIIANLAISTFSLPASRSRPEPTLKHTAAYVTATAVVQARLSQWDEKTTAKTARDG